MLRLQIDGVALECEQFEGATARVPLVFLHEGLGSLTQWRGFPQELCQRSGRPGLAYARAGHGRSQPSTIASGDSYMHHEGRVVLPKVLERFGLAAPVLVGHSDGASIALIYAAKIGRGGTGRLGGLVLLAPHVMVEDCTVAGIAEAGRLYRSTALADRLARHHDDAARLFRSWHDTWLSPTFRRWDLRGLLASITVPVLLIQGLEDEYATLAQLDVIAAGISAQVTRVELAHCGHSPHLDQRQATLEAALSLLETLP